MNYWRWEVFIHNENDLPDATKMHPNFQFYDGSDNTYALRMRQFSKKSTRSKPCSKYHSKACKDVKVQGRIAKDFKCKVPIFYTGQHLQKYAMADLPICNKSITLKMISMLEKEDIFCLKSNPCDHTDYSVDSMGVQHFGASLPPSTGLRLVLQHVEQYQSYLSVSEQSLFGQVGGILGITLGHSYMTFVEAFQPMFEFTLQFISL
jgi:hypothetical protein